MVTVALIGADGAGKTTVARALERSSEIPIKYLYMGINVDASNHMLPTTRMMRALKRALGKDRDQGGPPDPNRVRARSKNPLKRALRSLKSALSTTNRLCEEWYRQMVAWWYEMRGYVVLFDRHFYADYYAHDVAGEGPEVSFSRRLHGRVLRRLYPSPDLVILLDAPASVLFARKQEGTVELLERRRQEYLDLKPKLANCAVVDVDRPQDEVLREVLTIIRGKGASRSGRTRAETARSARGRS